MASPLEHPAAASIRRMVDLLVAGFCLVVTFPIMALVAILIKIEDGGPIFYLQERAGKDGKTFRIYKFRSMAVNNRPVQELGQVREDHPLVTRIGRVIRRLKIDELPQLLNVMTGDLSLIGPRPTVPEQVRLYDWLQHRRLAVRPGMTGWAQINGNSRLSWEDRISLDIWYIDHWSPMLDLRILLQTITVILCNERIDSDVVRHATEYTNRLRRCRPEQPGST